MIVLRLQQKERSEPLFVKGIYRVRVKNLWAHVKRVWTGGSTEQDPPDLQILLPEKSVAGLPDPDTPQISIRGFYLHADDLLGELSSWSDWRTEV